MSDTKDKNISEYDIELDLIDIMRCIMKDDKQSAYAYASNLLSKIIEHQKTEEEQKYKNMLNSFVIKQNNQ